MTVQDNLENQLDESLSKDIAAVINRERSVFDEQAAPFGQSLVLFGAGTLGRKALAGLQKIGIKPLAFADTNPTLWNTSIEGLTVFSPSEAANLFGKDAAFVVTIWSPGFRFFFLKQQLLNMGCLTIISFVHLFQKYPDIFLPHVCIDLPHKIHDQTEEVKKAMSLMADHNSRVEFLSQLKWLLDPIDMSGDFPIQVSGQKDLPTDLFSFSSDEVFIDCGAYNGDTIKSFIEYSGSSFRSILAMEPDPQNFKHLESFFSILPENEKRRMQIRQVAVGATNDVMRFSAMGTVGSSLDPSGSIKVDVIKLDDIIRDGIVPTFIKMDIEGAEIDALLGGKNIIGRTSPILSVCVYHRQDHLWKIPLLIQTLSKDYKFYLRRYTDEFWDLVCFCIPASRAKISI